MDLSQNRSRQEDASRPGLHVTFPAFFSLNASLKGALLFVPGFVLHYSQIMFAFLSSGAANERLFKCIPEYSYMRGGNCENLDGIWLATNVSL